ncbi:MAG: hypothetical protein WBM43_08915 [Flavobacteriaceae bacterium]
MSLLYLGNPFFSQVKKEWKYSCQTEQHGNQSDKPNFVDAMLYRLMVRPKKEYQYHPKQINRKSG